jgi:hypothetical protein
MAHGTAIIRTSDVTFAGWSWSAVLAGLFASLVVQILLTMLGFGVGLLSVDMNTAGEAPKVAGWVAFVWWAVSGIIAAFIGGAVAAANAPDQSDAGRAGHALAAWAVAVVVVTGASALTAGSAAGVATNLAGPSYQAITQLDRYRVTAATTGQAAATAERPNPAQVEEARRHFAYVMLASFCALILGAFAAYGAGMATTPRVSRQVADAVT